MLHQNLDGFMILKSNNKKQLYFTQIMFILVKTDLWAVLSTNFVFEDEGVEDEGVTQPGIYLN